MGKFDRVGSPVEGRNFDHGSSYALHVRQRPLSRGPPAARGTPQGVPQDNPQGVQDLFVQLVSDALMQGDDAARGGAGEFMPFQSSSVKQAHDFTFAQNFTCPRAG